MLSTSSLHPVSLIARQFHTVSRGSNPLCDVRRPVPALRTCQSEEAGRLSVIATATAAVGCSCTKLDSFLQRSGPASGVLRNMAPACLVFPADVSSCSPRAVWEPRGTAIEPWLDIHQPLGPDA